MTTINGQDDALLPNFVVSTPADGSFVKSVRGDFSDVTPYFANLAPNGRLTRMEYKVISGSPINGICLMYSGSPVNPDLPDLITNIKLLNLPPTKYTLNINGFNVKSFADELDISVTRLNYGCQIWYCNREYLKESKVTLEKPALYITRFETVKICHPKKIRLPDLVEIVVTGYYNGQLASKKLPFRPRDTYGLGLNSPTDHLIIRYNIKESATIQLLLKKSRYDINLSPNDNCVCIKFQDPHGLTNGMADTYLPVEIQKSRINFSRIDIILLTNIDINQIVQCYYMTYRLPTTNHIGALEPECITPDMIAT